MTNIMLERSGKVKYNLSLRPPLYPAPLRFRIRLVPIEPQQLKAMTIAAGFQCKDGVILAADTEISLGQTTKTRQSKLFVINKAQDCCLTYAGHVAFAQELVGVMRSATRGKEGKKLLEAARKSYRHFHNKYYTQPPKPEKSWADVLITLKEGQAVSLYCGQGRHWFKVDKYKLLGIGEEQAEAVVNPLYSGEPTTNEAGYIAICVLRKVKWFVQGCGGPTEVGEIRHTGPHLWSSDKVEQAEEDLDYFEGLGGHPKPANDGHLKTGQR